MSFSKGGTVSSLDLLCMLKVSGSVFGISKVGKRKIPIWRIAANELDGNSGLIQSIWSSFLHSYDTNSPILCPHISAAMQKECLFSGVCLPSTETTTWICASKTTCEALHGLRLWDQVWEVGLDSAAFELSPFLSPFCLYSTFLCCWLS